MTGNTDFESRHGEHVDVDVNQPLDLQIHHRNGDVTVQAVDRNDVLIVADDYGHFGSGDDFTFAIDVEQNRIRIQSTSGPGAGWPGMSGDIDAFVGQITRAFRRGGGSTAFKPGKVRPPLSHHVEGDVVVEIPRSMSGRIEVHNTSGDIQMEGVQGEIALTTVSGDVRLDRTGGELTLQTANGDVTVEGGTGRLTARTASGDVSVEKTQCDGFHVTTANGDVRLDVMLTGNGPFQAQTANGDVQLTLRQPRSGQDSSATLVYRAVSGDAHISPPFRKIDHRRWQMGPGDGGPTIEVMTVSGDLTVDVTAATGDFNGLSSRPAFAPDAPPAPHVPEPPVAPPAPTWRPIETDVAASTETDTAPITGLGETERLAVLEAVERGEIDVEEALRRLEAADGGSALGND